jgi:hypothetical protein
MALNERRIAVIRGALKGHVHSSLELVATLTESAKTEKDPSNGVHVKLLRAQKKLAEQNVASLDSMPSIRCVHRFELGACPTGIKIAASPKNACGWRTRANTWYQQGFWRWHIGSSRDVGFDLDELVR